MAASRMNKIRDLRKRGKTRLVRVNDQLNALTWDLLERNGNLNDVNTTRAVAVLDDALSLIQRAGALLNSVHIEQDPANSASSGFVGGRDKPESGRVKTNVSRSVSSVN
jgi:hypothetical protein